MPIIAHLAILRIPRGFFQCSLSQTDSRRSDEWSGDIESFHRDCDQFSADSSVRTLEAVSRLAQHVLFRNLNVLEGDHACI